MKNLPLSGILAVIVYGLAHMLGYTQDGARVDAGIAELPANVAALFGAGGAALLPLFFGDKATAVMTWIKSKFGKVDMPDFGGDDYEPEDLKPLHDALYSLGVNFARLNNKDGIKLSNEMFGKLLEQESLMHMDSRVIEELSPEDQARLLKELGLDKEDKNATT